MIHSPLQRVARPSLVVFGRHRWRCSHGRFWFMISRSRFSPLARNFFCTRSAQPSSCLATQEHRSIYSPPAMVCATQAVPLMNSVDLVLVPDPAGAASFNFFLDSARQSVPPVLVHHGIGARLIHLRVLCLSPVALSYCCKSSNFWLGFSVRNKIRIRLMFFVMGRLVL
jgi:hypothetical protein